MATKKREPRAWLIENGVRTPLEEVMPPRDPSAKLSAAGRWLRQHPNGLEGEIVDMRAVMK